MAWPALVGMDARVSELMAACQYGHWADVDYIINYKGAYFHWEDPDGQNALHYACMGNNYQVALRIKIFALGYVYRGLLNRLSSHDETPLHIACRLGYPNLASLLIDARFTVVNSSGQSPLHVTCVVGHTSVVRELLGAGRPCVNDKDCTGTSPLHAACSNDRTEIVRILLENNAHVNDRNNTGCSPLHLAVENQHREALHLLLGRSDLNINVTDNNGRTALHLVCRLNIKDIAQQLITHGANPSILDESHETPLHIVSTDGSSKIVELLLTSGAVLDTVNIHRETALYLACKNGHSETVGLLLDHGAKLHVLNALDPVQIAIGKKHKLILNMLTHHLSELGV